METTTQNKINYLKETKHLMKEVINRHGGTLTDASSFRSYINELNKLMAQEEWITFANISETNPGGTKIRWSGELDWAKPFVEQGIDYFADIYSSDTTDSSSYGLVAAFSNMSFMDDISSEYKIATLALGKWYTGALTLKQILQVSDGNGGVTTIAGELDLPLDCVSVGPAPNYKLTLNDSYLDVNIHGNKTVVATMGSMDLNDTIEMNKYSEEI